MNLHARSGLTRRIHATLTGPSAPFIALLTLYTLLALSPLLDSGYFYAAHDGQHNVFYQMMFDAAMRDGALWPRWAMHHIQGYGYPTFVLQAPVGFYVGQLFVWLGAGYTAAVKWTWAVGFFVSGWGMYALTLHWLRSGDDSTTFYPLHRWAALIAGVLYVFIPYHLVGIYVRAALNDTLLFAWFPWVFLTFDRLIVLGCREGMWRRVVVAALVLSGALLTHTFALLSFAPLLATFVLFRLGMLWFQSREFQPRAGEQVEAVANATPNVTEPLGQVLRSGLLAAASGVAALLLIAAFLLPLVVEGQHLEQDVYVEDTYHYRNHFVYPGQYFSPFWGFGYSNDPQGAGDGMSFQVGSIALLLILTAIFQLWQRDEPIRTRRHIMIYLLAATVGLLFLMTPAAAPIWDSIGPLALIQFPWRLLSLAAFTASAPAGLAVANLLRWRTGSIPVDGEGLPDQNEISAGAVVLTALVIFGSYGYVAVDLQPVEAWREDGRAVFRFEEEHPDMIAYTKWVEEPLRESPMTSDYQAEDYTEAAARAGLLERLAIIQGEGEVLSQYSGGSGAGGVVRMDEPGTVRVHLFYFPGWQATLNGAPVEARVSPPHGLIEIDAPPGEHRIDVRMGATPARTLGSFISWGTLLGLATILAVTEWRRRR